MMLFITFLNLQLCSFTMYLFYAVIQVTATTVCMMPIVLDIDVRYYEFIFNLLITESSD